MAAPRASPRAARVQGGPIPAAPAVEAARLRRGAAAVVGLHCGRPIGRPAPLETVSGAAGPAESRFLCSRVARGHRGLERQAEGVGGTVEVEREAHRWGLAGGSLEGAVPGEQVIGPALLDKNPVWDRCNDDSCHQGRRWQRGVELDPRRKRQLGEERRNSEGEKRERSSPLALAAVLPVLLKRPMRHGRSRARDIVQIKSAAPPYEISLFFFRYVTLPCFKNARENKAARHKAVDHQNNRQSCEKSKQYNDDSRMVLWLKSKFQETNNRETSDKS
mmetsp:Transcript_17447/g.41723  ORF Transcript_17447/g.41723 Transcript_17447/m.41723 type:complete len:276 (+) Transcript_17447:225-1052(+)